MLGLTTTFLWVAGFAIGAAFINAVGIFAIFKNKKWAKRAKPYLLCFAAGVLITTPLTLALPNALSKNPRAGFAALAGFLFMFFSNEIITRHTKQKPLAFGITAAEGIGIHSLIDGVVYAVTFSSSIITGFIAGLGLLIHEFAEGVITFLVLLKGGVKKKTAALYAFLISSLTTPIGAFLAYPFVNKLGQRSLGLTLGFVSGVLLYISAAHLLPEAREHEKHHSGFAFLGGVILALFIVFTKMF